MSKLSESEYYSANMKFATSVLSALSATSIFLLGADARYAQDVYRRIDDLQTGPVFARDALVAEYTDKLYRREAELAKLYASLYARDPESEYFDDVYARDADADPEYYLELYTRDADADADADADDDLFGRDLDDGDFAVLQRRSLSIRWFQAMKDVAKKASQEAYVKSAITRLNQNRPKDQVTSVLVQ